MEGLLHQLAAVRWQEGLQGLIRWLNVLLTLAIAYLLAGITWQFWPEGENDVPLLPIPVTPTEGQATRGISLDAVAALHLLGEAVQQEAAPLQVEVDAPETRLSLTLRGIIALSSGGVGMALIAEGAAEERLYKVGDSLSGSAVLHEVQADRVLLKRAGRLETLTLPRDRLESTDGQGTSRRDTRGVASVPPTPTGGAISQQLRSLRDEVAVNPQLAFSLIQAQPVVEGGNIKGYRVNPGRQRQLFQGSGLRPGDVVTHVNGVALGDPAQMATLFAQFKSAERFDLTLERGGQPTSLTIDLEQ